MRRLVAPRFLCLSVSNKYFQVTNRKFKSCNRTVRRPAELRLAVCNRGASRLACVLSQALTHIAVWKIAASPCDSMVYIEVRTEAEGWPVYAITDRICDPVCPSPNGIATIRVEGEQKRPVTTHGIRRYTGSPIMLIVPTQDFAGLGSENGDRRSLIVAGRMKHACVTICHPVTKSPCLEWVSIQSVQAGLQNLIEDLAVSEWGLREASHPAAPERLVCPGAQRVRRGPLALPAREALPAQEPCRSRETLPVRAALSARAALLIREAQPAHEALLAQAFSIVRLSMRKLYPLAPLMEWLKQKERKPRKPKPSFS